MRFSALIIYWSPTDIHAQLWCLEILRVAFHYDFKQTSDSRELERAYSLTGSFQAGS